MRKSTSTSNTTPRLTSFDRNRILAAAKPLNLTQLELTTILHGKYGYIDPLTTLPSHKVKDVVTFLNNLIIEHQHNLAIAEERKKQAELDRIEAEKRRQEEERNRIRLLRQNKKIKVNLHKKRRKYERLNKPFKPTPNSGH